MHASLHQRPTQAYSARTQLTGRCLRKKERNTEQQRSPPYVYESLKHPKKARRLRYACGVGPKERPETKSQMIQLLFYVCRNISDLNADHKNKIEQEYDRRCNWWCLPRESIGSEAQAPQCADCEQTQRHIVAKKQSWEVGTACGSTNKTEPDEFQLENRRQSSCQGAKKRLPQTMVPGPPNTYCAEEEGQEK